MIPMKKTSRSLSRSDQLYIDNHTIDPPAIQLSQRQLELRNRRSSHRAGGPQPVSPPSVTAPASVSTVEDDKYSWRGNRSKRSPRNLLRLSPRRPAATKNDDSNDDLARQRALVRSMMRRKESTPKQKSEKFIRNVLERALESTKKKPKDPPVTTTPQQGDHSPVHKSPRITAAMESKARKASFRVPTEISARQSVKSSAKQVTDFEQEPHGSRANLTKPNVSSSTGIDYSSKAVDSSRTSEATTGYRDFVRNLANEASASHSYLMASMETAITGQAAPLVNKKSKPMDSATTKQVAKMNSYLEVIPCERQKFQAKQVVSDKQYDKARKKSKQPAFSTKYLVRERKSPNNTAATNITRNVEFVEARASDQQNTSIPNQQRQQVSSIATESFTVESTQIELTSSQIEMKPKTTGKEKDRDAQHQPKVCSSSATTNVEAVRLPKNMDVEASNDENGRLENSEPKVPSFLNRKTLRSIKPPPPQAPEAPAWTKIRLKPVKREPSTREESSIGNSAQASQTYSSGHGDSDATTNNTPGETEREVHEIIVVDPVPEDEPTGKNSLSKVVPVAQAKPPPMKKTFKEYPVDQILLSLPLQEHEESGASRVVLGRKTIKCVQETKDQSSIEDCVVIWAIDRDEIEPDGINLRRDTFCIAMLLTNGEQMEILFENSEDRLRFMSAFFDAASIPPEVSENVSVNSSVRMESLNDEEQSVLERYRELRQTRPPMKAMAETLTEDSAIQPPTKPKPIDARQGLLQQLLLQKSSSQENEDKPSELTDASKNGLPEVVSAQDLPSSPVSTFTTTSVGIKTVTMLLNEDETSIANIYILMLKRGVPIAAVEHRLKKDGVDSKIAHAVLSSNGEDETQKPSSINNEDSPIVKQYKQMLKMGVPGDAVRHRMVKDGVEASIISIVLSASCDSVNASSEDLVPSRTKNQSKLSPSEELEVAKYRKLLKLQVSREALLSRMQNERVDDRVIEAVLGKVALNQGRSQKSTATSTNSKLINLHWQAMDDVPAGSVWEYGQSSFDLEKSDIHSLVEQFQKKPTSSKQGPDLKDKPNLGAKAKLLDVTRANNVAISLKAFKDFSYKELAEIIGFLDPCRKVLGERAQFIRDLLPSAKESTLIMKYQGSDDRLGPAEQWFKELQGIKRIDTKARVIRTMEFFSSEVSVIRNNFKLLSQVCSQIKRSTKLVDVLKMVLKVGNTMNAGTRSGDAAGFRFDSLLRLTQTKTTDGKMSVLDYIVSVFVEKGQRDKLNLVSDFPELHTVSRFLIVDMQNEVKALGESLSRCKEELKAMESDIHASTTSKGDSPKVVTSSTNGDPRNALVASIAAKRNKEDSFADIPKTENFAKRDDFLAAIDSKRKASLESTRDSESRRSSNSRIENNFQGGMTRLRQFIDSVDDSFMRLQKQKDEALQCSKDFAKYCGETGGVGSTGPLLDTLSKFTRNVESALTTYDERQQRMSTRKKKDDKKLGESRQSLDERSTNLPEKDGRSLILMVNDVLKSANPSFKEDFKKGRKLYNPSDAVKAIYDKEATVIGHINSRPSIDSHSELDCNDTAALTTSTVSSTCQSSATPSPTNQAASPTNTEVIGAALDVIKTRAATEQLPSERTVDGPSSNGNSLSARALHKRQMRSLTSKPEAEAISDQTKNAGESTTARLARMKRLQIRQGTPS